MNIIDFCKWENEVFGYSYGTGEDTILTDLRKFLNLIPESESTYKYEIIEEQLGKTITWLFINILCRKWIIDYGSSPRFGWLSEKGNELKCFLNNTSNEEIINYMNNYLYC